MIRVNELTLARHSANWTTVPQEIGLNPLHSVPRTPRRSLRAAPSAAASGTTGSLGLAAEDATASESEWGVVETV